MTAAIALVPVVALEDGSAGSDISSCTASDATPSIEVLEVPPPVVPVETVARSSRDKLCSSLRPPLPLQQIKKGGGFRGAYFTNLWGTYKTLQMHSTVK